MVSRSWPNTEWAYLVANGLPVGPWVTTIPRSNRPEQTRTKAMRSRWLGSMLACTLNTKAENGASSGRGTPGVSSRGLRRRRQVDDRVEQQADAEVGERRPEEHRRHLALPEAVVVEPVGVVEQLELVGGRASTRRPPRRRPRSRVEHLLAGLGGAAGGAGEAHVAVVAPVDDAAEVAGDADRPGDRRRHDRQLRLDLVEQLERLAARAGPTC